MKFVIALFVLLVGPVYAATCQDLWAGTATATQLDKDLACLSWTTPVQYADGAPLPIGAIIGFKIYYGTTLGALDKSVRIDTNSATGYSLTMACAPALWHFKITALGVNGTESVRSQPVSKQFECVQRPNPPSDFRVEFRIVS